MFNFHKQEINSNKNYKNLRKNIPTPSSFKYGSKKISFNVKNRSQYWDNIEKIFVNDKVKIDYMLLNEIKKIIINNDTNDSVDTILYSSVSPVLAVTLLMLNEAIFKTDIFSDYIYNTKNQVYAYTHWTGESFSNGEGSKKFVIDNPFSNETDRYMRILPGYNNINAMKLYYGYQVFVNNYNDKNLILNENNCLVSKQQYQGSYNLETKRFHRIYNKQPELSLTTDAGTIDNYNGFLYSGGTVETINKNPEVDSYLYADGIFKRLMESPYNSESYQISIIRGAYGFGPINIASFLNAKMFNKENLVDIIIGLFIAEDSGMTLIDAIKGIQEWRGVNYTSEINTLFNSLSDIKILKYIEYIGSNFFTTILGSLIKENPTVKIPLTDKENKIYDIGYLMGHNYDVFVQMFINGIKNKIWMNESTEIFSFEIPCIILNSQQSTGLFNMGNYEKNFYGSLNLKQDPFDSVFNVSSIIEKEKEISNDIIPKKGYSIFDFITKGLNKTLIENIIKNIHELEGDTTTKIMSSVGYVAHNNIKEAYKIYDNVPIDFNIAPRDKDNKIDRNFSSYLFNSESTVGYIASPAKLNRISIGNNDFGKRVIVGETRYIVLYDEEKNYKIKTKLLYVNRSGTKENYLVSDLEYYITNNKDKKVFSVLNSSVGPEQYVYEYINNTEDLQTTTISNLFKSENMPTKCTLVDIYSKEIYNFKIFYDREQVNELLYTISNISDNPSVSIGSTNAYNSLFLTIPSLTFNGLRTYYINGVNVLEKIFIMFNQCNFNPIFYRNEDENNKYQLYQNYLNKMGLCILKISTINSFCMSYSLDLLNLPDMVKSFYDIYKSYISNFIDIREEFKN